MLFKRTIPFALAVLGLQAAPPLPRQDPGTVPLYRVTVVQGSAKAIKYRNLKSSTEVDLKGTVLCPGASGEADVKGEDGAVQIRAKVKGLPPPASFGGEFLTYVLWGISPEGRATNLGELILEHGKAKVKVTEKLQTFGLIVTAEPYFAVSQPSDVVVMENAMNKDTKGQVEYIDARFELLKRGQYTLNLNAPAPMPRDEKAPFALHQARNAVRIARATGAQAYAPDAYGKAVGSLERAEAGEGGAKGRIAMAREAVQRAEDARLIAVQKQEAESVAVEARVAQAKVERARRETAQVSMAKEAAVQQTKVAEAENAGLRSKLDDAKRETAQADASEEAARKQTQAAEAENDALRTRLRVQLNAILETRATARGLIVNMSGVLFQNGQATLVPAAREKLSKIAGILATHKGLRIEADGFTDSNGSDAYNQRLSEQRAEAARTYLISQGVASDSIFAKGYGEGNPIATNDTEAGRQENRRVELVVSGPGITSGKAAGL